MLKRIVLKEIQAYTALFVDYQMIMEELCEMQVSYDQVIGYDTQISKLKEEYNRYYSLKASLGDDLKEGLISKEEFDDFRESYGRKCEELEQMIEQLKALPYVRRSSLNYAFELENDAISGSSAYYPNDKKWDDWSGNSGNNWNMKAIDAPGAWVYHDQMQPVNVGIIEELFDPYHEDLSFEEMPFGNISAMGPYKYNGLGWWTSKQSHGTHVAGIIGATFDNGKGVCGVAPNAKLYGANWKNGDGGKFYYTQKAALGYLVQKKHCRVLNLSFSIGGYGLRYSASQGGLRKTSIF